MVALSSLVKNINFFPNYYHYFKNQQQLQTQQIMDRQRQTIKTYLTYLIIFTVVVGLFQQLLITSRPQQNLSQKPQQNIGESNHQTSHQQIHSEKREIKKKKPQKLSDQEYLDKIVQNQDYIQPRQLKFIICTQSYNNVFQQMKQQINNLYPDVIIISEDFPLPSQKKMLSTLVNIIQYGLFFLVLFGNRIQAIARHPLYARFLQNKWTVVIGLYFLMNTLKTMVGGTGAFQVYLQNELIFSKLHQNRMPDIKQIIAKL